nr:MAG TPA: hypothetical protein [Caudoviricetes sp.]
MFCHIPIPFHCYKDNNKLLSMDKHIGEVITSPIGLRRYNI